MEPAAASGELEHGAAAAVAQVGVDLHRLCTEVEQDAPAPVHAQPLRGSQWISLLRARHGAVPRRAVTAEARLDLLAVTGGDEVVLPVALGRGCARCQQQQG